MTWSVTLDLSACMFLESPVDLHVQLSRTDILGTTTLTADRTCMAGETCSATIVMDHLFLEARVDYEGRFNYRSTGTSGTLIAGFGVARTRCDSLIYYTTCPGV